MPDSGAGLFQSEELGSFDLGAAWFRLLSNHALEADSRAHYYALLDDDVVRCLLPLRFGARHL
jgi:hypothetical protein